MDIKIESDCTLYLKEKCDLKTVTELIEKINKIERRTISCTKDELMIQFPRLNVNNVMTQKCKQTYEIYQLTV
jgi:hypothetical protein